jgi:hypothetical protein
MPARIATTTDEQRSLITVTRTYTNLHRRLVHKQHWAKTAFDLLDGLANALEGRLNDVEKKTDA